MSIKQKDLNQPPSTLRQPIKELDGYDLVEGDTVPASGGFLYKKEVKGTNTSGEYGIYRADKRVGHAALAFSLRDRRVYFDVGISESGHNLGSRALRGLADTLSERGFDLVTGGISTDARGYWQHLAERGDVIPLESTNPNTQYQVVPHVAVGPAG